MSDDPNKRGKEDQDRVSQQPHEVKPLAERYDLPESTVEEVIGEEGPMRKDVIDELEKISEEKSS
jgi:hypothetical protein